MSRDDEPEDNLDENGLEEEIIEQTADLLEGAGRVIEELRKRQSEAGESYDVSDMLERVQVAQVLMLVASGHRSIEARKEHEKFMADLDAKNKARLEESKARLDEITKQVGQPRPVVQATPAPLVPPPQPVPVIPVPAPPPPMHDRQRGESEMLFGVQRTPEGTFEVDVFLEDFEMKTCKTWEELTTYMATILTKIKQGEKNGKE